MGTDEEVLEISNLERGLLSDCSSDMEPESHDEPVLFAASFQEMEDNFIKYQTVQWVLISLPLILAWGIGLLMLLYLPVRRYILRKDIQSKKLYLTPNSIIYKVIRPVPFPCFGVSKKEKHVLLPSVADIIIEQGYLQSLYGVYSLRIENAGLRRPPGDDVQIEGVTDPNAFKKAVLMRLSGMRNDGDPSQSSTIDEITNAWASQSKSRKYEPYLYSGEHVLQKVEEVGTSVKLIVYCPGQRVQALIEERRSQVSNPLN